MAPVQPSAIRSLALAALAFHLSNCDSIEAPEEINVVLQDFSIGPTLSRFIPGQRHTIDTKSASHVVLS